MLYEIRHVTTYHYASRVAAARCLLHLEPVSRPGQAVLASEVQMTPPPVETRRLLDFFGNAMQALRFADLPTRLVLNATAPRLTRLSLSWAGCGAW